MSCLRIAPIVEGHGEVEAVRILLERTWRELLGGQYAEILRPVRRPRSKLLKTEGRPPQTVPDQQELARAIGFAAAKLMTRSEPPYAALILVLLDANSDCPKELAPALAQLAEDVARAHDVACILANVEYETWFVSAAESLRDYVALEPNQTVPEHPEDLRLGKGWIERRFKGTKYSETVDQPKMTAEMDLSRCRQRSPSFDKLCRELEKRLRPSPPRDGSRGHSQAARSQGAKEN